MYRRIWKRWFDVILAALGLCVFALPMGLIALLILALDGVSPLFVQRRAGADGVAFDMYKFRTMKVAAPPNCPTDRLEGAQGYITPLGGFLRRTSLDELPQLINVLKGQMSLIGPRPALYNQELLLAQRRDSGADALRPGITGWAQIHGRDMLTDEQKAVLDGEYARRLSFRFDCLCLLKTVGYVLRCKDVSEGCPSPKDGSENE